MDSGLAGLQRKGALAGELCANPRSQLTPDETVPPSKSPCPPSPPQCQSIRRQNNADRVIMMPEGPIQKRQAKSLEGGAEPLRHKGAQRSWGMTMNV